MCTVEMLECVCLCRDAPLKSRQHEQRELQGSSHMLPIFLIAPEYSLLAAQLS